MSQVPGLWISQMPWMNWLDWNWQSWKFGLKRSNNGKVRIVEEEEAFLILQRFERSLIRPPGRFTSPLRWKSDLFFQFFQLIPPWSFCEKFGEKLGKFGKLSVLSSRRAEDACRVRSTSLGCSLFQLVEFIEVCCTVVDWVSGSPAVECLAVTESQLWPLWGKPVPWWSLEPTFKSPPPPVFHTKHHCAMYKTQWQLEWG